jgi:hypothetical protein
VDKHSSSWLDGQAGAHDFFGQQDRSDHLLVRQDSKQASMQQSPVAEPDDLPYALRFPSELNADQVTIWLHSLSGLLPGRVGRLWGAPTVVLELRASAEHGFQYRLVVPRPRADYIVGQLRTAVPGVRVAPEKTDERASALAWTRVVELGMHRLNRTLRVDPAPLAGSVLASLQGFALHQGEAVLVQWVIRPAVPQRPPQQQTARPVRMGSFMSFSPHVPLKDAVADQRAKLASANFLAVLRVGVHAGNEARAGQLLGSVQVALKSTSTTANALHTRSGLQSRLRTALNDAKAPLLFPMQLTAEELTGLLAWPIQSPHVAGLPQARTRHLPAGGGIARQGRVLAVSNFPGNERPLALTPTDSVQHLHVCGPTGTGKSVLLANLAAQDMAAGYGVVVIEGKGGDEALFSMCLDRIPEKRLDDTIVLDVTDAEYPVAFNILAEGHRRTAVDELCALFDYLYRETRGVWTREVLYHGLSTLAAHPGCTFPDLAPLLMPMYEHEAAWRDHLIEAVTDRELRNFWQRFRKQPEGTQTRFVQPVLDRIWQLNSRPEIRNIIGQSVSSFTMEEVVSKGRVLLVNLAGLGRETASLAGTLIVSALWRAVQATPHDRPVLLYLDEFQDFLQLPLNPADMFAKARGFGLGITAAHQDLGQLPVELRQAVLANARSKVVFQCAADDARAFAREFGRSVSDEDFMRLGRFEVLLRLATSEGVSEPVTGITNPPSPLTEIAAAVRARSRQRYARPLAQVEADITARRSAPDAPPRKQPRLGGQTWD